MPDPTSLQKRNTVTLVKADRRLGIAFGYLFVSREKKDGQWVDYYDLQGDHIGEDEIVPAAYDFQKRSALAPTGDTMHDKNPIAEIAHVFPLTSDIADALKMDVQYSGLLIGFKPNDPAMLDRIESGELACFSLDGSAIATAVQE